MPLGSQKAGLLAASSGGLSNWFGDGSDGAVTSSGDITYTPANAADAYDGDMVVKNFTTFTLSVGDTLTVDNGCAGLLLYSTGNMTINGTIDMNGRGTDRNTGWATDNPINDVDAIWLPMLTASPGSQALTVEAADFTNCGAEAIAAVANQAGIAGDGTLFTFSGGSRGSGRTSSNDASPGTAGSGGVLDSGTYEMWIQTGGGGGGGAQQDGPSSAWSSAGGKGSPISGGSGGGGVGAEGTSGSAAPPVVGNTGTGGGGVGVGGTARGGGGGGQPGGPGPSPYAGLNGNGGIIWLICGGVLTLGASSTITSVGSRGGSAAGGKSGGGGASGSGGAHLIYVTSYTDSGCTFTFTGADGGSSNASGGAGGTGAYIATQVSAP